MASNDMPSRPLRNQSLVVLKKVVPCPSVGPHAGLPVRPSICPSLLFSVSSLGCFRVPNEHWPCSIGAMSDESWQNSWTLFSIILFYFYCRLRQVFGAAPSDGFLAFEPVSVDPCEAFLVFPVDSLVPWDAPSDGFLAFDPVSAVPCEAFLVFPVDSLVPWDAPWEVALISCPKARSRMRRQNCLKRVEKT